MRANVAKHLPVVKRQIEKYGWLPVRKLLEQGKTKYLSGKDRREMIKILDAEDRLRFAANPITL